MNTYDSIKSTKDKSLRKEETSELMTGDQANKPGRYGPMASEVSNL